jgi:enoyl-CoA hydratase
MSEADVFLVEVRGGVARCLLNRPPLNLLEPGIIDALRRGFEALAADASMRVAVLSGAGRAFSAGMDVSVLRDVDPFEARQLITSLRDAIEAVHTAPFPVIAEVQGACLGGAFELALACDLRVASEKAVFGLPEVRLGLPSVIHAALLPRLVPAAAAAELLLTGSVISAAEAQRLGLLNRVAPHESLASATEALVGALLAAAPGAVRLQKQLIVRWRAAGLPAAIEAGVDAFAAAYGTDEPREGAAAFLEKRRPRWEEG